MSSRLTTAFAVFSLLITSTAYAKKKTIPKSAPQKLAPQMVPGLLQEIEAKYAKAETLVAAFSQQDELAALKRKKASSGRLSIRRPDKVRWETVRPHPGVFVSDGKKVWMYTPPFDEGEAGELRMGKASQIHSKLAQALLSGSFSMAVDMKIEATSSSEFKLTPLPGAAGSVLKASIKVNLDKRLIEKVMLEHKGGNKTEISLTEIELGRDLPDAAFAFVAPANTVTVKD